jgi:hypothetical protein
VKIDKRFPLQVALTLVVGLATGFGLMKVIGADSSEILTAAIVGAMLSAANVVAGFLAIEYSFEKSYTTFLKAVLGGMGIRMALLLGTLALLIRFSRLETIPLVVSVLSFYTMFLVLEIFYIQRKLSHKQ